MAPRGEFAASGLLGRFLQRVQVRYFQALRADRGYSAVFAAASFFIASAISAWNDEGSEGVRNCVGKAEEIRIGRGFPMEFGCPARLFSFVGVHRLPQGLGIVVGFVQHVEGVGSCE